MSESLVSTYQNQNSCLFSKISSIFIIVLWIFSHSAVLQAQGNETTIPAAIFVGNSVYEAPIIGVKLELVLLETFDNVKRPIMTPMGEYYSDSSGLVTISLLPNKSYMITATKSGYLGQLSKLRTHNFSRTTQNKKGISLRPRNVIDIKGNIALTSDMEGTITLIDKSNNFSRRQRLAGDGAYSFKTVKGEDYELKINIEGVIDTIVNIDEQLTQNKDPNNPFVFNLIPNAPKPNFKIGDAFTLENFDLQFIDRSTRLSSEVWIDSLEQIMDRYIDTKFEIQIHTDSRYSDRLNYLLCKKRKAVLEQEFLERNMDMTHLTFNLKGEDEIINQCVDGVFCNRNEHAINNRVVIIIKEGPFYYKLKSD